jgi:hypothetical protein
MYRRRAGKPAGTIFCMAMILLMLILAGCQGFPFKQNAIPAVTQPVEGPAVESSQVVAQPIGTEPAEIFATEPAPSSTALQPAMATPAATGATTMQATPGPGETTPVATNSVNEPAPSQPTLPPSGGPQLAFLNDQDVWLLDQPTGKPYPLTVAGDILSYAWSPDGQRLVTYNGHSLCFFHSDGSVHTACLELGLDDFQAQIPRNIIWSPDQRWIVLWNSVNPWDEGAIGWLIVNLDTTNDMYRIQDPTDWGASLAPDNKKGGFTGEAVFLPDGKLVGTLSHSDLCSEGGCHYQLYQFDFETKKLAPYPNKPEEGWSEGMRLALSDDGRTLTNYGVFFFGCDSYVTFADSFDLASQARVTYNLENQAMLDLGISPDGKAAVFSRTAGCQDKDKIAWNEACGLFPGFEIYAMQYWEISGDKFRDLPPGINPDWSPDNTSVAFNSCLVRDADGQWKADADTLATIYIIDLQNAVTAISTGSKPSWRPR